jgi:hypothetical protein
MLTKRRFLIMTGVTVGAIAAAAAGAITSRASNSTAHGHGMAVTRTTATAGSPALDPAGWRTVAEARATLNSESDQTKAELGLKPNVIASLQAIYTFSSATGPFAGLNIYGVSRGNSGGCYFLLGDGDCWAHPPAVNAPGQALPVQAGVSDFDGPAGSLPIVLFGHVAPQVETVVLSCNGSTYTASISDGLVTWIAPSPDIGAADCTLSATLAGGHVFNEQL